MPGLAESINNEPLNTDAKLAYHLQRSFGPLVWAGAAAGAAVDQWWNVPREWGQGWDAFGRRFGDNLGTAAVRHTVQFGLEAALRQDPRYIRSERRGVARRGADAIFQTVVTRTDGGRRTFAAARVGSAFGAAFLEGKTWYPARLSTNTECLASGGIILGVDAGTNLFLEFWPGIRRVFRRIRIPRATPLE